MDKRSSQRGAVMIVALIMIVIISVVVVSAFVLSSSNLRSVGNVQFRQEAIASANRSLETIVSGSFLGALNTSVSYDIDIDKNGTKDYTVTIDIAKPGPGDPFLPGCPVRVNQVSLDAPSGFELGEGGVSAGTYVADWELIARVDDAATGASTRIRHGVRLPMGEADYQKYVAPCGLALFKTS
jgi:hypothetical protein